MWPEPRWLAQKNVRGHFSPVQFQACLTLLTLCPRYARESNGGHHLNLAVLIPWVYCMARKLSERAGYGASVPPRARGRIDPQRV